jgi:glutathione synthase/RimK-type ligase-like ATP-grasp enzyme
VADISTRTFRKYDPDKLEKNNIAEGFMDHNTDIAILVSDEYSNQPYEDDLALKEEIEKRGRTCQIISWRDLNIDYRTIGSVIIRSCWDYDQYLEDFLQILKGISHQSVLFNSYGIVEKNSDKTYLKELEKKGIAIIPTIFLDKAELDMSLIPAQWKTLIVKPSVSASGRNTYRVSRENAEYACSSVSMQCCNSSVMIQPYIESIENVGERSTIMIGGLPVFTMKKTPEKGGFLVHEHYGGTYEETQIDQIDRHFLKNVWNSQTEEPLFMRVDYVYDDKGKPLLLELEMIEPNLYLARNPLALKMLADKLCRSVE